MLKIRRAERRDAEAAFAIRLQAIRHQCGTRYTADQVMAWTDVPLTDRYRDSVEKKYHLVCVNEVPVATGFIDIPGGELGAIFVLPEFMGQGIGKKLLVHLEQLARESGLAQVHLEATLNAAAFYRRCGFTGSTEAIHRSPSGLQLACIPMSKPCSGPYVLGA